MFSTVIGCVLIVIGYAVTYYAPRLITDIQYIRDFNACGCVVIVLIMID